MDSPQEGTGKETGKSQLRPVKEWQLTHDTKFDLTALIVHFISLLACIMLYNDLRNVFKNLVESKVAPYMPKRLIYAGEKVFTIKTATNSNGIWSITKDDPFLWDSSD